MATWKRSTRGQVKLLHYAVLLRRDDSQVSRYFLDRAKPFYEIGLAGSTVAVKH